jgi:hypothetical protein
MRTPKVNAFVVSFDSQKDDASGRLDLFGIIGSMQVNELPLSLPGLTVFASLTNLEGSYRRVLEVVELENDEILSGIDQEESVERSDPMQIWTEIAHIPGPITIDRPGRYACRLRMNGDLLHESIFEIALLEA